MLAHEMSHVYTHHKQMKKAYIDGVPEARRNSARPNHEAVFECQNEILNCRAPLRLLHNRGDGPSGGLDSNCSFEEDSTLVSPIFYP